MPHGKITCLSLQLKIKTARRSWASSEVKQTVLTGSAATSCLFPRWPRLERALLPVAQLQLHQQPR